MCVLRAHLHPHPTPPARVIPEVGAKRRLSGTHSVTRPPSGMGPGQAFRLSGMTRAGRDDARWKGGGRPSPQPAMPRLRGDKMWRQRFFLPHQPIVFLRFGIISPTFFAGKYAPLPSLPLKSSPSHPRASSRPRGDMCVLRAHLHPTARASSRKSERSGDCPGPILASLKLRRSGPEGGRVTEWVPDKPSAFRDDARGWDDARRKGGGGALHLSRRWLACAGIKCDDKNFFFPTNPLFSFAAENFSNFFRRKILPLPSLPLKSSPSLLREPGPDRGSGRAAETSPFGLGTRRPEGPRQPAVPGALGDSVAGIAEKPPGLLVRPGKAPNWVQPGRAGRPSDRPTVGTDSGGARWTRLKKKIEWLGQRAPLPNLPKRPDAKAGVAAMARAYPRPELAEG